MRLSGSLLLIAGLLSAGVMAEQPDISEARSHAKALGGALKAKLQHAIQSGGFVAGVEQCKLAAEPIAQSLSQNGWQVGRTALKVRNPDNAADEWEASQLARFAEMVGRGVDDPPEATTWNEATGEYRYMKAIITQPLCTGCHGSNLAPDVKQAIDAHYPGDQATGFEAGSLRGAFTLTWTSGEK